MAMVDYGSIVKKNGEVIQNEMFMDMKKSVGFVLEKAKYKNNPKESIQINGNYFSYIGDKEFLICIYKCFIVIVVNNEVVKLQYDLDGDYKKQTLKFNIENIELTFERLFYQNRYRLTFTYKGDKYDILYGYGVNVDKHQWYTKNDKEIEFLNKWYGGNEHMKIKEDIRKAINWNDISNKLYDDLYRKQAENFWLPEEIPLTDDIASYKLLSENERTVYENILAGLTLLDTEQTIGITEVGKKTENLFQKSIISLFAGFESIHARSYSTIFQTLCSSERIDELFNWVEDTKELQTKVHKIIERYQNINSDDDLFMAMIGSLCLEGICFYSGFFLPLLLAGQGKMVNSGEIINLILRDEKLHTIGIGLFAQEELNKYDDVNKEKLIKLAKEMILEVYESEVEYTKVLYKGLEHLIDDVITYIQFNVDYTLSCIKLPAHFNVTEKDVNPIVINGYSIETKNHDFFSTKGNGYTKTTKVEELNDDDFNDLF